MIATVAVSIPIVREHTQVVRTRTYSSADIPRLIEEIKQSRITGQLCVNFSQGGISSVEFEESQKINP